ncbi:hypothetical protein SAMN05421690_102916 [Nitrosomonas sp. Nm51]|uniref:hypothetical protein n=1 Tax=Nitrosomonas sp. Nm51 TaxID=133720 RepID=UPI0008D83521|nr:hypothetical protein [Nitrosomonas sp. Nm51]SER47009.1 hypothetical protein SAMN05421690_102916 [Nitrosomonas sp. Nm51]
MNTYQNFVDALGFRESSSIPGGAQHYDAENPFGFIGKYQFGEAALFDLGYYGIDGSDGNLFRNDWTGNWSGKNGINSKQDYFDHGVVQEIIIRDWHEILWRRIQFLELEKFEGQTLNGQLITASGMLAVAHLIGAGSRSSDTAGLKGYLLSGAVLSPEDANGTSANDYMELFASFETPFTIDHGFAERIEGGSGKDYLTGFGGNDTLIGNAAIDTAVYSDQSSNYEINKLANGRWTVNHLADGTDGMDTLIDIERIAFSDSSLALDLDGNAGITAKLLGAVFGQASISNKQLAGTGLRFLDNGVSYETLTQLALDAALGNNATDRNAVVNLLYENVTGFPPSAADEAHFVGLLDSGEHTIASIGILAAETALNQNNIDLIGLSQTGLEFF